MRGIWERHEHTETTETAEANKRDTPTINIKGQFIGTILLNTPILQSTEITKGQKHEREKKHGKHTGTRKPLKQAIHHTEHSSEQNLNQQGVEHT